MTNFSAPTPDNAADREADEALRAAYEAFSWEAHVSEALALLG